MRESWTSEVVLRVCGAGIGALAASLYGEKLVGMAGTGAAADLKDLMAGFGAKPCTEFVRSAY